MPFMATWASMIYCCCRSKMFDTTFSLWSFHDGCTRFYFLFLIRSMVILCLFPWCSTNATCSFHEDSPFVHQMIHVCSPNDSQMFHKCSTKMEKVLDSQVVETKCQTTVYSIWMSGMDTGVLHLLYIYAMERPHFSGKVL